MTAIVDSQACTGCGVCVDTCPEVFHLHGDVAEARPEPVPAALEDTCRQAADDCPMDAISIE